MKRIVRLTVLGRVDGVYQLRPRRNPARGDGGPMIRRLVLEWRLFHRRDLGLGHPGHAHRVRGSPVADVGEAIVLGADRGLGHLGPPDERLRADSAFVETMLAA
eukprot:COSAG04_NODE_2518_length_3981_cov_5.854199_4_plen_104_part_00